MPETSEIAELQRTVRRLEKQLDEIVAGKLPRSHAVPWVMLSICAFCALFLAMSHFGPEFGIGQSTYGEFSSVEARTFRIRDDQADHQGTIDINSTGPFVSMRATNSNRVDLDSKSLRLENGINSVRVDSNMIRLENERGTLILELNEKGEPVLRSGPNPKKK